MGTLAMTHTLRANDDQVCTAASVDHAHAVARCCVAPTTTAAEVGTEAVRRLSGAFTLTVHN